MLLLLEYFSLFIYYLLIFQLVLIGEINAFPKCKGVLSLMFCAKLMNEFLVSVDM